jgi:23S rRNA (guanosine2251-2'-O)-methyltransferase
MFTKNYMSKTCVLILDNLRSVENTGSIFRTAEGLGVAKVVCVGTTPTPLDRFGRKRADFAKVSLGAEDSLEWEYVKTEDLRFTIQDLREQGFKIIALEQDSRATNLVTSPKPLVPFVLIVGNEVEGVSKEVLEMSDEVVEIMMQGEKESLNVSVSTGIALYELLY